MPVAYPAGHLAQVMASVQSRRIESADPLVAVFRAARNSSLAVREARTGRASNLVGVASLAVVAAIQGAG
ncbi:hypothetical protein GCM10011575_41970 [Microlunatus endophyticus]|uniref:Uncharacterized protein n=1 Tax=Microlunatus endophyticus TaxID=1716077 RepID=A0A917SHL9_9ACTN|nr:hypothetical protein GCM10011575_41970 [Microlunatus endophyticus]